MAGIAILASAVARRLPTTPGHHRRGFDLCGDGEIAGELYISLATVKTHLSHLQMKVEARNRVELAAWAWATGRMDDEWSSAD